MTPAEPQGALAGVRVLDLTRILAGPLCTMMLGDMGADVIKVEPPGAGDDTRSWGPPFAEGESAYYLGVNRNKRSMTLNMAMKSGQEVLAGLIKKSDVLVENFKVGTLEKWGFGNDWLQANAPRLVRCSITGYGSVGPKAGLPGYDFILQAESGLMSITGEPEGTPMKYGVAIVDICTGMLACNSVLAALNARHTTGRGQHVEVSLFDSGLAMLANVASNHLVSGKNAGRFGNGHPNIVPYTAYPTRDDMIAVAVGNDGQFAKFCDAAGQPAVSRDARFSTNPARVEHRATLVPLITGWTMTKDTAEWVALLDQAGVPCAPILDIAQVMEHPHVAARGMALQPRDASTPPMVANPMLFDGQRPVADLPPPALDAHQARWLHTS